MGRIANPIVVNAAETSDGDLLDDPSIDILNQQLRVYALDHWIDRDDAFRELADSSVVNIDMLAGADDDTLASFLILDRIWKSNTAENIPLLSAISATAPTPA